MRTFVHAKLRVHETVAVGANLHCLIYNVLTDIIFSVHILLSVNSKISVEDMLNTKGLVALTECQQVGSRLIKAENCKSKNYQRHT